MVTVATKWRRFLPRGKAMTNLDSILKNRHIPWLTKACLVKARLFPVVMYGFDSWTIKKPERRRMDAFKLWCWRRFLKVPCTVNTKGNQPWIFTGRTDAEAEVPILWPPEAKSQFTGKDPDARKDWEQGETGDRG